MRRIFLLTLEILLLTSLLPAPAAVAAPAPQVSEPDAGSVLCPTGLYPDAPDDCLPLGPSAYLASLAQTGILWPIHSLPAYKPDRALADYPYRYFKVDNAGTYVFPSLTSATSDATSGWRIGPGYVLYVAYLDRVETDAGIYYYLLDGGWIRGEGARLAEYDPPFQGLLFSSTPRNPFGWVLEQVESRVAPGYTSAYTGKGYYKFNVVQVYAVQSADGVDWLLVGPDEWLEARHVARVEPRTTSPEGVATPRWIEINLYEQTLAAYDNNQLVFATMVSTGADPYWTRPGIFSIYQMKPVETMSGSFEADRSDYYYLEAVPWTMYFDGKRALHGAYWHNKFGYETSHGCVNMSMGDSHWLFDWAREGDVVYVHDPSGRTPTDPAVYGAGAP
jgi:lipoprotein-anchoring transpeptidase ErfK/SrfK